MPEYKIVVDISEADEENFSEALREFVHNHFLPDSATVIGPIPDREDA